MSTPQGPYQGPPPDGQYPQQGGQYPQDQYGQYSQQGGPQQGGPQQGNQYGGYPGQQYGGYAPVQGYGGYQQPPQSIFRRGVFWESLAAVVVIVAGVVVGLVLTSGGGGGHKQQAGGTGDPTGDTSQSQSASPTDSGDPTGFGTSADGGSGSASTTTDPTTTSSGDLQTSSTAGGGHAAIGTPIDAKGQQDGERLAITVVAVDQNAQPTSEYDKAPTGDHFVAVEFKLLNTGTVAYNDAVDNCVSVLAGGSSYKIQIVSGISSGSVIDSVNIAPHSTDTGWSVFPVPIGQKITSVTYKMDSGLAGGGTWNV